MAPLIAAVGVLGLLVFVTLGMVIELYRDIRQLREAAGILDRPLEVELGEVRGSPVSRYGLPLSLDEASAGILLFLSDRCGTCHALAAGFGGRLPDGLWIVLEAGGPKTAAEFLERYDLDRERNDGRVLVDPAGRIGERLGLRTTPVGFFIQRGHFVRATTVPSRRYLATILPDRIRLEPATSPPMGRKERELEWAG